jgi:hypothetical protein
MTWFNIGDEQHDDPVMRAAGLAAFGLYAAAGSYCMRQLTEGFVPAWYVKAWPDGPKAATVLVKHGIWGQVDGGYHYVEWRQESAEKVRKRRAKWRADKERQAAAARAAKDEHSAADSTVESRVDSTVDSALPKSNSNVKQPVVAPRGER